MDIYYSKKWYYCGNPAFEFKPCDFIYQNKKKEVKYIIKLYIYFQLSAKLSFDNLISDPLICLVMLHLCKL